jgi:hypothetical protein
VQAHVQSPNLIRDLSAAHWIFVAGSGMGKIFCRATLRHGELSRAESKAKPGRPPKNSSHQREELPTKGKAIKASGLSTSAAHRAEALAGARSDLADEMGARGPGIDGTRRGQGRARRGDHPAQG